MHLKETKKLERTQWQRKLLILKLALQIVVETFTVMLFLCTILLATRYFSV